MVSPVFFFIPFHINQAFGLFDLLSFRSTDGHNTATRNRALGRFSGQGLLSRLRSWCFPRGCVIASREAGVLAPGPPQAGRLAVLGALRAVVAKFPTEALDASAEQLALPLVLRLVNDPSSA